MATNNFWIIYFALKTLLWMLEGSRDTGKKTLKSINDIFWFKTNTGTNSVTNILYFKHIGQTENHVSEWVSLWLSEGKTSL